MVIRWWPSTFYPNYERDQLINGYKNKNEFKFKFIISRFKDDYWDNTKSKEDNKKRQGGWERVIQWQALQNKIDIDNKNKM